MNKQFQGSKKKGRQKAYLKRQKTRECDKWAEKIGKAQTLEEMANVWKETEDVAPMDSVPSIL